jgi:hypothetical protein
MRLTTEWSTDSDKVAEALRLISNERDMAIRLDLEAALHMWQAMDCTRRAEWVRAGRRPRHNARVTRGETP